MQPRRADEKTLDLGVGVRPGIHQVYETLASRAQRACQVSAYVAAGGYVVMPSRRQPQKRKGGWYAIKRGRQRSEN